MNFQDVIRDVHDPSNHALQISGTIQAAGQATVSLLGTPTVMIGTPTLYAVVNTSAAGVGNSIVTIYPRVDYIGLMSVSGNVNLNAGLNNIGFATVYVSTPTLYAIVNTDAVGVQNSIATIASVTLGTYAVDDSAMPATPQTLPVSGEYRLTPTTYADGDVTVLQTDENGALKVILNGDISGEDSTNDLLKTAGNVAHDSADVGHPVKIGGKAASSEPAAVAAADRVDAYFDTTGHQHVKVDAIAAGNTNIGDVDVASIAAGDNNIGNVDIASALPAGTNAIGKLAANSGVDIGDVDVTSLPALAAGTNAIGKLLPSDIDVTAHTNYARKYYTSAGAATDGIIWSPAAGKRWHVVTLYIQTSADATITLEDDKAAGDDPVWKGEIAAKSGVTLSFTEKYPMASGEDAADLLITTSAGNCYVTVVGYEI